MRELLITSSSMMPAKDTRTLQRPDDTICVIGVPSSARFDPLLRRSLRGPTRTDNPMMPVGVLGGTVEEHEEHTLTEQWPERAVEVGDQNPGFSLRGYGAPPSVGFDDPNSKNSYKLLAQIRALADALRDYWRLDGKLEGLDEGLEKGRLEGLEKGRVEGREEVLREALWVAKNGATAKSLADNRGAGRPSSLDEETREMLGII